MVQWNGFFWIDNYNDSSNTWLRQDFSDSVLFSIEELDSGKFYSVGKYIGYYIDGTIAFNREHYFDGEYSYIHGKKQLYYPNGKLKEDGQYHLNIKIGKWTYFNKNGETLKTVEYNVPFLDSVAKVKHNYHPPLSTDLISVKERNQFTSKSLVINFGKNGFEVILKNNVPTKLTLYEKGKVIFTETNQKKIRKLLAKHSK